MTKQLSRGFTLIELLVVIAIIGILSSVVLGSLQTARVKAYDAKRVQELKNIATALTLYRDTTGTNPVNQTPGFGYVDYQPNFLQELVTAGLLPSNPKAPNNDATNPYAYYVGSCRPWLSGQNWCDQSSNRYYCICIPY